MSPSSEYDIPPPTRIKLKKTKAERAAKIFRKEQRRVEKIQRRIARANADREHETEIETEFATGRPQRRTPSPPQPHSARPGKRRRSPEDESDEDGDEPGDYDEDDDHREARAREHARRTDWNDRMDWFAHQQFRFPFEGITPGFFFEPSQRIPRRHQDAGAGTGGAGPSRRAAVPDPMFGNIPFMGDMTDNEYASFVRAGFERRQAQKDRDERERQQRARRTRILEEEREDMARERERRRKADERTRERAAVADAGRTEERRRWRARVSALKDVDGDVVAVNLRYADIPWPVYTATGSEGVNVLPAPADLTSDAVRAFLHGIADDDVRAAAADGKPVPEADKQRRKVVLEASRVFHSDRFGHMLERVRPADREAAEEAAATLSRILNDLK